MYDTWLNIYASAGGAYCVYTENGICSAEAAYSAGEIDTVFSNMDTFSDRDFQRNLQIFSNTEIDQNKFSGSQETQTEDLREPRSRSFNFGTPAVKFTPGSCVPTQNHEGLEIRASEIYANENPNYSMFYCSTGADLLDTIVNHDIFQAQQGTGPAELQCIKCNSDEQVPGEVDDPNLLRADQTQFWIESEAVLAPTGRAADKQLNSMQRHSKCGHVGYHPNCLICNQLKGSLRRVYSQSTPIYDCVIGRTWSFDSIYWSHRSRQGNKYTVAGRESNTGYPVGAHFRTRETNDACKTLCDLIMSIRSDPELGSNKYVDTIFLDPAGEWSPDNKEAMDMFKEIHVHVIHKPTATEDSNSILNWLP